MPLGMEVGIGRGDFVFDGDPTPPEKRHSPHRIFGPCLLWPNGWMDQVPLGTEVRLGPGDVLDGVAAPLLKGAQPPVFGSCLL